MVTFLVILALALGVGYLIFKDQLKDENNNNIPDVVEKPIVAVVEKVKKSTKKDTPKKSTKKSVKKSK